MSLDNDAREFGQHFRQGGWRLGLLVARNVKPGKAGRPPNRPRVDNFEPQEVSEDSELPEDIEVLEDNEAAESSENQDKVSISAFAAKAGVSKQYVANYYNAWELAADDGLCPHAEQLSPGEEDRDDIEQDDEHTRELWSVYLQKAKEPNEPREPREPKAPGTHRGNPGGKRGSGSGSKADKTPQAQLHRAVEQVSNDAERLSEHLSKLTHNVSVGTKAVFPGLAQDLREIRQLLEKHCGLIDEVLDFTRHGDVEEEADAPT